MSAYIRRSLTGYGQLIMVIATLLGALWLVAQEPLWWQEKGITTGDPANNRGPANIGQAKNVVKKALETLDETHPEIASQVEAQVA